MKKSAARKRRADKSRVPDWAKILAPPKARGRKREARRWRDVLAARCTNGPARERIPGQRLISIREGAELYERSLMELEIGDPTLYRAVREVMFEDSFAEIGLTYKQWQKRAMKRALRWDEIRRELAPASARSGYTEKSDLRSVSPPAEVAERQTR